jgi:hypothetical protein
MSRATRRWSWRKFFARTAGSAAITGATGAAMASVTAPPLVPIAAGIGAVGGAAGAVYSTVTDYFCDDPAGRPSGSDAMYMAFVSGVVSTALGFLSLGHLSADPVSFYWAVFGITAVSSLLAGLSLGLFDDVRGGAWRQRTSDWNEDVDEFPMAGGAGRQLG